MNRQLGLALLFLLVTAGSAYSQNDRGTDRLDASRARSEARYGTVGNQPETETVVRQKVITVTVPDTRSQGLAAGLARPPKKKQVLVKETVTVTKPAPVRVNPY